MVALSAEDSSSVSTDTAEANGEKDCQLARPDPSFERLEQADCSAVELARDRELLPWTNLRRIVECP